MPLHMRHAAEVGKGKHKIKTKNIEAIEIKRKILPQVKGYKNIYLVSFGHKMDKGKGGVSTQDRVFLFMM